MLDFELFQGSVHRCLVLAAVDDSQARPDTVTANIVKQKFYTVSTLVKEFSGCKNVTFDWFRAEMPTVSRSYATRFIRSPRRRGR